MTTSILEVGRPKKPKTDNVRLEKRLLKNIRMIAGHLDISVPDYLKQKLTPIVEKELAKVLAEKAKELDRPE